MLLHSTVQWSHNRWRLPQIPRSSSLKGSNGIITGMGAVEDSWQKNDSHWWSSWLSCSLKSKTVRQTHQRDTTDHQWVRGRSRSLSPRPKDCYNCGQAGHYVKDYHWKYASIIAGREDISQQNITPDLLRTTNKVCRSASPAQDHGKAEYVAENQVDKVAGQTQGDHSYRRPEQQATLMRQFTWGPTSGMTLVVPVYIEGRKISAVVDTAAQVTLVRNDVLSSMQLHTGKLELVQLSNAEKNSDIEEYLYTHVGIVLGQKYFSDIVVANISDYMILGLDFLNNTSAGLTWRRIPWKCRIETRFTQPWTAETPQRGSPS